MKRKESAPTSTPPTMIGCVVPILVEDYSDEEASPATVITPRPSGKLVPPVTPDHHDCSNDAQTHRETDGLTRELEEARQDAQQSAQALDNIVEGIRLVKRILERDHSSADSTTDRIEELKALSSISERLHGVLGSDLLGLLNAADMVREHARLSVNESAALVHDVAEARDEAETAKGNARQLKKIGRKLYRQNVLLRNEVQQLRSERKALVSEVTVLRDEAEVRKKYDAWRLLEHHVLDSIQIHERVLRTPATPKLSDTDSSASKQSDSISATGTSTPEAALDGSQHQTDTSKEIPMHPNNDTPIETNENESNQDEVKTETKPKPEQATQNVVSTPPRNVVPSGFSSALRNFFTPLTIEKESTKANQQEDSNSSPDNNGSGNETSDGNPQTDELDLVCDTPGSPGLGNTDRSEAASQPVPKSVISSGTKSPVPGLEEVSRCCTDDSSNATRGSEFGTSKFPSEFAVNIPDRVSVSGLSSSPLPSPNESPTGVTFTPPKPICDQNILRTLAIPTGEDASTDHVLYARTTLDSGLYEC